MKNAAIQVQTQSKKPQLALIKREKSESWIFKLSRSVTASVARFFTQSEDIETWRRLEYRNEIPREREIERSMWRM